jgi:chemotaxis protein methyltransferase CheR
MTQDAGRNLLLEFSRRLAEQTGLYFPNERNGDLERGISRAAQQSGFADTESYLRGLLAEPLTLDRISVLARHLTVGETYFFRDKTCFDFLEEVVLPELIRSRQETRVIRIWSAGCSSGEEPYSIAMLLDRLLPDIDEWTIQILATDLNPSMLTRAGDGIYDEWSFRDVPDPIRINNFSENGQKKWKINGRAKRLVTFSYHNLAADPFPPVVNGTNAMDLILCRNVLMYLSRKSTKKIVSQFSHALTEGGWLVLGPVETPLAADTGLTPVQYQRQTFFRKGREAVLQQTPWIRVTATGMTTLQHPLHQIAEIPGTVATLPIPGEIAGRTLSPAPSREAGPSYLIGKGLCEESTAVVPARIRKDPGPDCDIALLARTYANTGDFDRALFWCEQGIASDRLNPTLHYLHATIQEEHGNLQAGLEALRRTLYLDPDFILAHIALGSSSRKCGHEREATRYFANAHRLLKKLRIDDPVPESGGLTAGHLQEILKHTGSAGS